MGIFKTNLTTKCFVIDYTESTKLMCKNTEEELNFLAFTLAFTSPALSSTSARKILWATYTLMSYPAQLLLLICFWRTSRNSLLNYSWFNLGAAQEPMKTWTRYKTQNKKIICTLMKKNAFFLFCCSTLQWKKAAHYFSPTLISLDTGSTF